jgi:amino acid adenylation domain-containing protein
MNLHDLIRADPRSTAIRLDGKELTYGQLETASNRLSHRLLDAGARPGTVTAIRLPRGLDLPVAIVAALKAGTAYLPLDPDHPTDRHLGLLGNAHLLVTTERHALATSTPTVLLDPDSDGLSHSPNVVVPQDSLAYVLPTSGTTGGSKLVAIAHRAAVNTITHVGKAWDLDPDDVVLYLASLGYSAAVRDLFAPLAHGATLELPAETGARAVEAVSQRLGRGGVTCLLSCLPQVLSALLDLDTPPGDLRLVVLISETLSARLAERARDQWPGVRFVHQYGLTECAMTSLVMDVPADLAGLSRVPVGRPITGTDAYILDERLQPADLGELYLAGTGLARGYHDQPAATAGSFVADPFRPGTRMYRTGDQARRRPAGVIEYLGRTDRQVKVRGHRVELDEIELALQTHPGLRAAAVHTYQHQGDPVLVGYVVPHDTAPTPETLSAYLACTLPEAMTALRYIVLPELPMLPNGKIDRRSLPPPPTTVDITPTESDTERLVADIWSQVLGIPAPHRDDDVFSLGAHSMHVVRVTARLRRKLGVRLLVEDVFQHRSVAALAAWLSDTAPAPEPQQTGKPAERTASPAQQGLWFLDRLRPGSAAYTIAFTLSGHFDVTSLRQAVENVVRRHAALRTTFEDRDGEPHAVVHDTPPVEFTVDDVDEMAWTTRPFDLAAGPLLRVAVRPDGTRAWFAVHHIVADDWSVGVFLRDLATAYDGRSLPAAVDVEPVAATASEEWLERLRAVPPVVHLPRRPAVVDDRGGVVWRDLSPSLIDAVYRVADALRATPFMVALAAWSVLLARSCGQDDDLLIGTLSGGRSAPHAEDAVGLFVNTVPVPVQVREDDTFTQLVADVRARLLQALDQADVPFERLVGQLRPDRAASHAPLVQVVCDWVDEPPATYRFGGAEARLRDIEPPVAKFDLWLSLRRQGDRVRARVEYRDSVFTSAEAELLADRYVHVLLTATTGPAHTVSTLDILPPVERHRVLVEWNDTEMPVPDGTVLDLVRGHDGIAVRCADRTLTYTEIHQSSDRLARHLAAAGIGADDVVAVCLPRTPDLVVAILGVLKAGAAYLPLDPAYPQARLDTIVARAKPAMVLSAIDVPDPGDARIPRPQPENLAYVLFTSGSTGVPKGVALTHRGLLNLVTWARRTFSRADLSGVAAVTSVCFDLSVFELFAPLSVGGTVELLDDALSLSTSPAAERITLLNTVPSAIAALLDDPPPLPALRRVNLAGEALGEDLVARIATALPGRRITNLYGPTETTTYATAADCPPVTIGRPIGNTQVYLLDERLRPVPPGTPAELYIGGAGLARGYYGQTALTAARFVPNPFGPGLLYRTGDLARHGPDGMIDYLGRADRQLKIRGHRIEPAEVESVLRTHPTVQEAVAGPAPDPAGNARLVAWAVTTDPVDGPQLRRYVAGKLPAFLVPSLVAVVDTIPRNLNGKVDWAALTTTQPSAQPASLTVAEEAVSGLWTAVLGVSGVTPDSHFFELGAHSITATRLIAQVNRRFGVDLPVSTIFAAPLLRDFARQVEEAVLRDIIDRRGGTGA